MTLDCYPITSLYCMLLHVHTAHGFHCVGDLTKKRKNGKEKWSPTLSSSELSSHSPVPITAEFLNSVAISQDAYVKIQTLTSILAMHLPSHSAPLLKPSIAA